MEQNNYITAKEYSGISILLGILSAAFLYYFSTSTSPIIPNFYSDDSAVFQVVGKAWANGKLPYVDVFDHKGPFIFMMEAIGYKFEIGKAGLLFGQWIFCLVDFIFIYKIGRLFMSKKWSLIHTVLSYVVFAISIQCGNLTEEYSLPFIIIPLFFVIKYFITIEEREHEHPFSYALYYGVAFAVLFMMRATSAISICCIVLVVLIDLLIQKKWICIAKNMFGFIGGVIIATLPFAIYFGIKGAMYDMVFGTIIYNLMYTSDSVFEIYSASMFAFVSDVLLLLAGIVHVLLKGKKDILGIFAIVLSLLTGAMVFTMNGYIHYFMILMPYYMVGVCLTVNIKEYIAKSTRNKILYIMLCGCISVQLLVGGFRTLRQPHYNDINIRYSKQYQTMCNQFSGIIPDSEKDSVLAFGKNSLSAFYLGADILPCFKYCFSQDWQARSSEKMTEEIYRFFDEKPAKWLVVNAEFDSEEIIMDYIPEFRDIIQEKYEIVSTCKVETNYECYHLCKLRQ